MKTKTILTTIALSSAVALSSPVLAEDPVVPSNPTDVVVETPVTETPVMTPDTETPVTTPAETPIETPADTAPVTEVPDVSEEPVVDTPIETPIPNSDEQPIVDVPDDEGSETPIVEKPSESPVSSDKDNSNSSKNESVENKNTKPLVTVSPDKHEAVVEIPSVEQPLVSLSGDTIIGTQDGQVLVDNEAGYQLKTPEEVGGKTLADGRIEVKDKDNKLRTLPSTGEKTQPFLVLSGLAIIGFLIFWYRESAKKLFKGRRKDR